MYLKLNNAIVIFNNLNVQNDISFTHIFHIKIRCKKSFGFSTTSMLVQK
jgi:hypothetical protein